MTKIGGICSGKWKFHGTIEYRRIPKRILKCISSGEIDKYFDCTIFKDKPECKQAMIHGMCIVSMLTSDCNIMIGMSNVEN